MFIESFAACEIWSVTRKIIAADIHHQITEFYGAKVMTGGKVPK